MVKKNLEKGTVLWLVDEAYFGDNTPTKCKVDNYVERENVWFYSVRVPLLTFAISAWPNMLYETEEEAKEAARNRFEEVKQDILKKMSDDKRLFDTMLLYMDSPEAVAAAKERMEGHFRSSKQAVNKISEAIKGLTRIEKEYGIGMDTICSIDEVIYNLTEVMELLS